MRAALLACLLSSVALAQSEAPATGVSPSTSATALSFIAAAGTGTQGFGLTQGARFCMDGTTCSKYFSSNGTTLSLTGLTLTIGSALYSSNASYALLANLQVTNDFTASVELDTSSNLITANSLHVPVVHGAATAPQAMERGNGTLTASALAVTFDTAFAAAPDCVCSHINATPIACGPAADPSTTAVTFNVTAGTGKVAWQCIGLR